LHAFLCAHPFVVRTTTLTFTYCGVQWAWTQQLWHNMRGGWMDGGMDQPYYQLSWDSSTIESGKGSNLLVTDLGFVHCNWFISKVPSIETHLGFIHPKIHPFAPQMLSNEVIQCQEPADMLIISGTYQGFFFEVLT
jgi:hypothetical protein